MQAGFYITPILYPLAMIANESLQKIILLNPMAQAIQDARYALVSRGSETITTYRIFEGGWYMFIPFVLVIVILIIGLLYFKKEAKYFAENI